MSKNTTKAATTLKQLKEMSGLFSCLLEHKVTETKAQFRWTGPKIPREEWLKVLAFFQWTYDTTHSESQVRLYVNARTGTWTAWAYPQKAKTGMSAQELDNDQAQAQRVQFSSTDGWVYFGTVHHHCNCSAFQSGVDRDNEQNQDGLHITVGDMGKDRYTLHDRFYLSGQLIDHDLDWFWDVGDVMEDVPAWAASLLPTDIKDRLARGQMIEKAPKDHPFPQQWKDNLIYEEVKAPSVLPTVYQPSWQGNGVGTHFQRKVCNIPFDLKHALGQLPKLLEENNMSEIQGFQEMDAYLEDKFLIGLIDLLYRNDVSLEKFYEYATDDLITTGKEANKQLAEGGGVPDYDGYSHWSQ